MQIPPARFVTLSERIVAAEAMEMLDQETADCARDNAEAANAVLHEEPVFPHADHSAKAYLGKLRNVLVAIDRAVNEGDSGRADT